MPKSFKDAPEARNRINLFEMAHFFAPILAKSPDKLSKVTKFPKRYRADLRTRDALIADLHTVFEQYDAILTPPTLGTAPEGLASTGNSIFNGIWTLTDAPAVTLPLFKGENGLPMGVQISGKPGGDARLLAVAECLETRALS